MGNTSFSTRFLIRAETFFLLNRFIRKLAAVEVQGENK